MPPELIDGVNGAQLRGEMFHISMVLNLTLVAACNNYPVQLRESIVTYEFSVIWCLHFVIYIIIVIQVYKAA